MLRSRCPVLVPDGQPRTTKRFTVCALLPLWRLSGLMESSRLLDGVNTQIQAINSKLDKLTQCIAEMQNGDVHLHAGDERMRRSSLSPREVHRRARSSGVLDQPQSLCPGFRGPTSSTFMFEVARDSVGMKGLRPEPTDSTAILSRESPPPTPPYPQNVWPDEANRATSGLRQLGGETVLQLCQDYDATIGILYPMLDMPQISRRIRLVFHPLHPADDVHIGTDSSNIYGDNFKFELDIIKLICAASLALKSHAERHAAQILYDEVDTEGPIWDAMGLKGLQYLALAVSYMCSSK